MPFRHLLVAAISAVSCSCYAQCDASALPIPEKMKPAGQPTSNQFIWTWIRGPLTNATSPLEPGKPLELGTVQRTILGSGPRQFVVIKLDTLNPEGFRTSILQLESLGFSARCRDADNRTLEELVSRRPEKERLLDVLKTARPLSIPQPRARTQEQDAEEGREKLRKLMAGPTGSADTSPGSGSKSSTNSSSGSRTYPYVCKFKCKDGDWHTLNAFGHSDGQAATSIHEKVEQVCRSYGKVQDRGWGIDCKGR